MYLWSILDMWVLYSIIYLDFNILEYIGTLNPFSKLIDFNSYNIWRLAIIASYIFSILNFKKNSLNIKMQAKLILDFTIIYYTHIIYQIRFAKYMQIAIIKYIQPLKSSSAFYAQSCIFLIYIHWNSCV